MIPEDPVVALLDELLEDYGDEWLSKCMFHYRWAYSPDTQKASRVLPHQNTRRLSLEAGEFFAKKFAERQVSRIWVVGSNETTAPVIEASYRRVLLLLRDHLVTQPFVLGERPGSGDFALYGQLSLLALFDPTPSAIALELAPSLLGWVEAMENLSGVEPTPDDWMTREEALGRGTLRDLLCEAGRVHVPFLLGNAQALETGATRVGVPRRRSGVDATGDSVSREVPRLAA